MKWTNVHRVENGEPIMRCPYCKGVNSDSATHCTYCGRALVPQAQPAQTQQQYPRSGQPAQGYPPATPPPYQQPQAPLPPQARSPVPPQVRPVPSPQNPPRLRQPEVIVPTAPLAPEPPAPFPSRTFDQLQALETGALIYDVIDTQVGDGRKKVVRISYPHCVSWQQVATLLKALKEQQETSFDTIVIEGVLPQDTSTYAFTNGQLRFDRNVRLGSQITNRYQIDTGNGFDSDAVRIVLTES